MVRFSPREAAEASGRTLEARPLPRALGGALTQCPWVQPLHPTLWSATLTCFWFPRTWGLRGHAQSRLLQTCAGDRGLPWPQVRTSPEPEGRDLATLGTFCHRSVCHSFLPSKPSPLPPWPQEGSQRLTWKPSRTQRGVETGDSGVSGAGGSREKGYYTAGREVRFRAGEEVRGRPRLHSSWSQRERTQLRRRCWTSGHSVGALPSSKTVRNPTGLLQSNGRSSAGPGSALEQSES